MQTVSLWDSLHEMSNPIFWDKSEDLFELLFNNTRIIMCHFVSSPRESKKKGQNS